MIHQGGVAMSAIDDVRSKVQRILTNNYSRVEIKRDGDFVVRYESAVTFVDVGEGFGDGVIVGLTCPLVVEVPLTPALFEYVATSSFRMGALNVNRNEGDKIGAIFLTYSIVGDDLDESELTTAVNVMAVTGNTLDNELQEKFGGHLFGREP